MPRRKKDEGNGYEPSQDATSLVNSGARADTIRAAARYIADREAEIAEIRADITEYKQVHIKGDLGFKLSDWGTVYRMYKLEGDDRAQLLDTIREGFGALGIGGQLDWVAAAESAGASPHPDNVAPFRSAGQ